MLNFLYEPFKGWSRWGAIYIISDPHLMDDDCKFMDPEWPDVYKYIDMVNSKVTKNDTLICLGDCGDPEWFKYINGYKVLIKGNHDTSTKTIAKWNAYEMVFNEVYNGPLFISSKILLSHEPVTGLDFCVNIHGHDHSNCEQYGDSKHINLAANVVGYYPVNLNDLIKKGLTSDVKNIHRMTIDKIVADKR